MTQSAEYKKGDNMFDKVEIETSELMVENAILADRVKYLEEKIREYNKDEVLIEEDVCNMFGFSKKTLSILRLKNGLPYHKFGRTSPIYFIRNEVESWAKKNNKVER